MKIYALTGTPGTGKTKVSKYLIKSFNVLNLNKEIKKNKLYEKYDKKRKCFITNIKKTSDFVKTWIKKQNKDVIIESHISHLLNLDYNIIFVLKCEPSILYKRLKKRKWNEKKIQENCEAEIFEIIENEAKERGKSIIVDTTYKSPKKVADEILKYIKKSN